MILNGKTVLTCTCRGTMALDGAVATELCRAELGRFKTASAGGPVVVACTQEAPAFQEAAPDAALTFVNIREAANWSSEADRAGPKTAALLAMAAARQETGPPGEVAFRSEGVTLVYGRDDRAVEAAMQLKDRLDLTVVITGDAAVTPLRVDAFPVVRGTIQRVTGHVGAFDLVVDGFAEPLPSSRARLEFGVPRDGARSRCDVIVDLSGGLPLVPGWTHRDGYLRASPDDPVAVQRVLLEASGLVGAFSKPRYVAMMASKCAHSRNGQVGCTRCLDVCPAGAIAPNGDSVAVDPHLCAGCGQCAAVCPTTAVRLVVPGAEVRARSLRTLLGTYRAAAGTAAVLLVHDDAHGADLVDMLARLGDGLPARVIPVAMDGQWGLDALATALAFGAAEVVVLAGGRDVERAQAVEREAGLMDAITGPLGFGVGRVRLLAVDDPFALGDALAGLERRDGVAAATYLPTGDKIALTNQALEALHRAAPSPVDVVALPRGAPMGTVQVDVAGCTLCFSCVSVCPTSALRDLESGGGERPMLKFVEDLCVQCGLCAVTCPEDVIGLEPRVLFGAGRRAERVVKEEEPAICIRCAKPFGIKSSIDRVVAQLAGKHWMFADSSATDRMRMCGDCRVIEQTRRGIDPYAGPGRARPRTEEDYR